MKKCPFCAEEIQDDAVKCKHCQEMLTSHENLINTIECRRCGKQIIPVVTSVGGGSCSVGRRDKFYCPLCQYTIKTEGCFVATTVYENRNAYEVLLLRKYRDKVLKRIFLGRIFINVYYFISPYVSKIVEKSMFIKIITRKLLDKIIRLIEKQFM
jgi:hypothetical protein